MRCYNVTAIDAHRDRAVRQRLLLPVVFRAFLLIQVPLIAQFLLDPFRRRLHELDEVALAYAITIHKSQGSEFPAGLSAANKVVVPLRL